MNVNLFKTSIISNVQETTRKKYSMAAQNQKLKTKKKSVKCCGLKFKAKKIRKLGRGIVDRVIDKLPFELHVPGYQYCGPGTHLKKRLNRGDPGINPLDAACKTHDIAYGQNKDSTERGKADKVLQKETLKRFLSKDASLGERATALGVAAAMKVKRVISGTGLSKKKKNKRALKTKKNQKKPVSFAHLVKNAKVAIKEFKPDNLDTAIKVAMASTHQHKKGKTVRKPRTIKLPSIKGGVLPLVPIFAGLGALGSIVGSAAGVANAINNVRKGQRELDESKRHNQAMETIALGDRKGSGYYLHRFKTGRGFYLKRFPKNH